MPVDISIIVPVYDEEDNVLPLAREIAGALRINPAKLGIVQRTETDFPEPILSFRDGPIWSAEAVAPWAPRQTPVPARERGLPRS